jgi:hypothetical protein
MQDQLPFQVMQVDSNRLYVASPGADFDAFRPFAVR